MKLFGQKKSASTTGSALPKTSLAVEMRIKSTLGIRQLESMPVQAAHAFQLASDPKARSSDFVKVIESDEVLSARIIRIANSVYFRRSEEARDIEKAVVNIGLDELRCLISATMLRSLLQGKERAREQIWANAVATAILCRNLSHRTNLHDGEAFLCGLLHDVGKLIMVRRGGKLYDTVLQTVAGGETSFLEAEERVFDLNHVEVGRWIAEKWHFPESARRAIAFHHSAWPKDDAARGKATSHAMLVKACDVLSHAAGIGHPATFRPFQSRAREEIPEVLKQLGMERGSEDSILSQLESQFAKEFALYQVEEV